jgi:hemolysin D
VQNGERVVAGQLLIELDPTQASADVDRAKAGKVDAEFALARAHALLTVGKEQPLPDVSRIPGATDAQQASAQAFAEGALREHRKKMSSANAELKRRQAELETTGVEIAKLEETLSLARQQESDYAALAPRGYVAAHDYLDKQKTVIEQSRELEAQRSRVQELAAAIEEQKQDIEVAEATFAREQWERLSKATTDAQQTQDEETKAVTRHQEMSIRSPVAGVVQQLAVHTVGGVVTTAQSLLEVVPDDALEVEARISNRDIGFVDPGQRATVKIATFPYTRFGYLEGTVIKVSNDAISDKKNGLVFLARIRIPSNHFQANRKSINLSPGMEVTAEVKTGRQRVWQYFLSPLVQIGSESLRER